MHVWLLRCDGLLSDQGPLLLFNPSSHFSSILQQISHHIALLKINFSFKYSKVSKTQWREDQRLVHICCVRLIMQWIANRHCVLESKLSFYRACNGLNYENWISNGSMQWGDNETSIPVLMIWWWAQYVRTQKVSSGRVNTEGELRTCEHRRWAHYVRHTGGELTTCEHRRWAQYVRTQRVSSGRVSTQGEPCTCEHRMRGLFVRAQVPRSVHTSTGAQVRTW